MPPQDRKAAPAEQSKSPASRRGFAKRYTDLAVLLALLATLLLSALLATLAGLLLLLLSALLAATLLTAALLAALLATLLLLTLFLVLIILIHFDFLSTVEAPGWALRAKTRSVRGLFRRALELRAHPVLNAVAQEFKQWVVTCCCGSLAFRSPILLLIWLLGDLH